MVTYVRFGHSSTTGFLSEIGTKLRDWAIGQAGGSCYSRAALSSNDSKTLYGHMGLALALHCQDIEDTELWGHGLKPVDYVS